MDKKKLNALEKTLSELKKMVFGNAKVKATSIKYKFEIVEDTAGQKLYIPVLQVGAPVTVGDSEGGEVASDGNYQLDENISIVVKDGVIESIVQPEEVEMNEDEAVEADTATEEAVITIVEDAISQIADVVAEIEAIKAEFNAFKNVSKDIKALTDAVAKFSKAPVATSVTKQEVVKDKTAQLADFIASKRNK